MTYSTVTGYPFDMNDDETEDEYVDRMIAANDGVPYDPYYTFRSADERRAWEAEVTAAGDAMRAAAAATAAENQDWNREVTDHLTAADDGWSSAHVHVQRDAGVMAAWSEYKGDRR